MIIKIDNDPPLPLYISKLRYTEPKAYKQGFVQLLVRIFRYFDQNERLVPLTSLGRGPNRIFPFIMLWPC